MTLLKKFQLEVRTAFADYASAQGCDCCRNVEGQEEALKILAKLLQIPKFKDGSGYDYWRFATKDE